MTDHRRAPTSPHAFRRPLRVVLGIASVAVLLLGVVAPVAAALESGDDLTTDTETTTDSTTDSTTETLEDSTTDDSTEDTTDDSTSTLEDSTDDTTGTLEDSTDEVVETTEDTVDDTSDTLLSEEEPSDEPSDDPSEEDNTEGDQHGTTTSSDQQDDGPGHDFDATGDQPSQEQHDAQAGQGDSQTERAAGEELDVAAMRSVEDFFDTPRGQRLRERLPEGTGLASSPKPVIPEGLRANPFVADHAPLTTGERSTVDIFNRLRALDVGPAVMVGVLVPFPVMGPASYSDDWLARRTTPHVHTHKGTDIFAMRGTPVIAVADGTITRVAETPVGGKIVYLTAPDGTYYYYAHLDGFALGLHRGQEVTAGTLLGYVGNTGNAVATPPHLHFEVHPRGGGPVPPVPQLDAWLADARERLADLEAAHAAGGAASDVALPPLVAPSLNETAEATGRSLETLWSGDEGLSASAGTTPERAADPSTTLISAEVDVGGVLWLVALTAGAAVIAVRMRRQVPATVPSRDPAPAPTGPPDLEAPLTLEDLLSGVDPRRFDEPRPADPIGAQDPDPASREEPVGHPVG